MLTVIGELPQKSIVGLFPTVPCTPSRTYHLLTVPRDNAERRVNMDLTDHWTAVTHQVRMYAASTNIRDVLVIDENVGINFWFPHNPSRANDPHEYIWASTELGSDFGDEPRLSLRELVVFFLLAALERNDVPLRDFAGEALSAIPVPAMRPYRNILPGPEPTAPPKSTKRPRSTGRTDGQDLKRGRQNPSGPQEIFNGWVLNSKITFEFMPEKAPVRLTAHHVRGSSLNSGSMDGTSPDNSPPKVRACHTPQVISHTVDGILKTNVALVTDGTNTFVAKLFCWSSPDTDPEASLQTELDAFAQCVSLQSIHIPYLHGVCRIIIPLPRYYCLVMLTEYIGSGVTVDTLVDAAYELEDNDQYERAEKRLAVLKASARLAVQSIHILHVVHADLAGRNMVVDEDQVVLVDFGCAKVGCADLTVFDSGEAQDLLRLQSVFDVC